MAFKHDIFIDHPEMSAIITEIKKNLQIIIIPIGQYASQIHIQNHQFRCQHLLLPLLHYLRVHCIPRSCPCSGHSLLYCWCPPPAFSLIHNIIGEKTQASSAPISIFVLCSIIPRLFYFIVGTLYYTDLSNRCHQLPHHSRNICLTETIDFLTMIQECDNPIIGNPDPFPIKINKTKIFTGLLSGLLCRSLKKLGIKSGDLKISKLSPSFYMPFCLEQFAGFSPEHQSDYSMLLTQLNHFPSWALFREFDKTCMEHLSRSENKKEFAFSAKLKLEAGNTLGAIQILEMCNKFEWPEMLRFGI